MNPIKSPREMLFEMAGIPSMAGGGKLGTMAEMYKLITRAIEQYTKKFGRPPSPEDVQALKQHAQEISKKTEIKTDPTTQARARHQMATDPNLINPEGPDPFLTKATTGRTVKGTYIQPKAQDITDPNVQANIEAKQAAGELEDIMPESITPSADYMARTSSAMENKALASGKTPMIDMLKAAFFKKNGRYPTDEELDVIIAEYNPMRHQYGERGASIVSERPTTARGMSDWRQQARAEGIPEAYLNKPPADYPKYLLDELAIGRGTQPGTRPMPETRINPDRSYAGGSAVNAMTPNEMQAMMVASGKIPSKLLPETRLEKIARMSSLPFAAMSAHSAGQKLSEGNPYEAALLGTSALGSGMASTRRFLKPGLGIAGGAAVPLSIDDAIKRYNKGDRTGAVISAIEAAGNAAAMYPPTAIPGTIVAMGAGAVNAVRGQPEAVSVMEDYK
jgi:hypothetical protein